MNCLSPSILSADYGILGEQLRILDEAGADYVHIDITDGQFVPSLTIGLPVVSTIRRYTDRMFDVHMMVQEPVRFVDELADAGADIITVHAEACRHLDYTIDRIKGKGLLAGVALNPETPLSALTYVLPRVDMVLVMTVNPGYGGQKLIPHMLQKVADLKRMIDRSGRKVDIEVDGGVTFDNVEQLLDAGANVIVAGSSLFGEELEENARRYLDILHQGQ